MNIILFITIIILIIIFTYQSIKYYKYIEGFGVEIDVDWIDKRKLNQNNPINKENRVSKIKNISRDFNISNTKYNQIVEFIPDKENYSVMKDSGLMIDIDKPIELNSVEFKNLVDRIDFYRKLESDKRFGDKALYAKGKMILDQETELASSSNYPLVRKEISLLKLDRIISNISKNYQFSENRHYINSNSKYRINLNKKHDLTISPESLESYRFVKSWILEKLSEESQKEMYVIKYVDTTRFKFKFDKIINYYIDYENNLERFEFQAVIYRENKEHNFFMYFDLIFDYKYINYYINNIIIVGVNNEEYLLFAKYLDKEYNLDSNNVHLSLSDENASYVTDEYINNYRKTIKDYLKNEEEKEKEQNKKYLENGYCFYKDAFDKNNCISYTPEEGVGIWDTPCKYNEDCPFFKKNRNYPNSRGGCINGYCEMPTNIKTLGYKEYNESGTNAAICYNCEKFIKENGEQCKGIECNQCCDLQKKKDIYPNLKSPDYAFPNDYFERIKHTKELEKLNLAPVKITI